MSERDPERITEDADEAVAGHERVHAEGTGEHLAAFGAYNVIGTFPDVIAARAAVAAAESAGFDDSSTSFLAVDSGAEPSAGVDRAGVTGDTGRRIAKGAVAGAAIGAVAIVVPVLGSVVGAGLLAAALGGGALGGATGAMVGAFAGLHDTDVWRDTYTSLESGHAVVGLHTDALTRALTADELLRANGADITRAYDSNGGSITLRR